MRQTLSGVLIVCACFVACQRRVTSVSVPVATGTVRSIRVASAPDGTAMGLVSLWKERGIPFEPGKPYERETAKQALDVARQYYRRNRISKAKPRIEVQETSGMVDVTIR